MESWGVFLQYIDLAFGKAIDEREDVQIFLALLMMQSRAGNLCITIEEDRILPSCPEEYLEQALAGAKQYEAKGPIVQEGNHYYLKRNFHFEKSIEKSLLDLLDRKCEPIEAEGLSKKLTEEQKSAVLKGLQTSFLLITGGPGRGKTFTASHILQHFKGRILVTAPTGKATARLLEGMSEFSVESGTLHSLLKIRGPKDFYQTPPRLEADLIIVDEASMIDARLFCLFLQAVPPHARLIIMGDGDQLPPVEAGDLFTQICRFVKKHHPENYSELTLCLRSDRKELLDLADHVRLGEEEAIEKANLQPLPKKISFSHFPKPLKKRPDPQTVLDQLTKFRILTPLREGRYGVSGIGKQAMEALLENVEPPYYFAFPILITKNNYDLDLYNGEAGVVIRHVVEKNGPLLPEDRAYFPGGKEIAALLLPPHEISYALSIHKSQGSEFDELLLLLPPGSERFSRQILYTGITRARKNLTICGEEEVFRHLLNASGIRTSNILK